MARYTPPKPTLRDRVSAIYGRPIPDETWAYLREERYLEEHEQGLLSDGDLVSAIRQLNAVAPAAIARSTRRVLERGDTALFDAINHRMNVTAEVIAKRAGRDPRVESCRSRWLNTGLIGVESVSAWIEARYAAHLPANWPTEPGPSEATNWTGRFFDWPQPRTMLEWIDEEAETTKVWCVPTDSPLGELSDVAGGLAQAWDWNVAYSTNFVLTGNVPPRPGVRGFTFCSRRGFDDRYGPYDYAWARVSIDLEVTPEQLAGWWRGVREHFGASGRRPITEKSVELARFALDRDDSTTFRQDMEAWNKSAPADWRFNDWRNYRTAARRAIDALNRPALHVSQ